MEKLKNIRVGIVGNGIVGKATRMMAEERCDIDNDNENCIITSVYDKNQDLCSPIGTTMVDIAKCDIVFVCVPTPMKGDTSCDTSIVESVVNDIRKICPVANIVVRSTVPPGTCTRLGVSFMPEFLTEKKWARHVYNCNEWILGIDTVGNDNGTIDYVMAILESSYKAGYVSSTSLNVTNQTTAEMIKYARNSFLATKVAFFNEIYDICESLGCDFENVRFGVCADHRIGHSHSNVPGHDGKRGFGGTGLPKDLSALTYVAYVKGVHSHVLDAVQLRNNALDRDEHRNRRQDKEIQL